MFVLCNLRTFSPHEGNPEWEKSLLVESEILGFRFRNADQGIRNPAKAIRILSLDSEIHSVESRIQDCVGLACVARVSAQVNAQKLEGVFCYDFIFAQRLEWIFRIA